MQPRGFSLGSPTLKGRDYMLINVIKRSGLQVQVVDVIAAPEGSEVHVVVVLAAPEGLGLQVTDMIIRLRL